MSKLIYAKALDNTQTLLGLIILYEKNAKKKLDMLNQIEKALEQAQKQEKLLELYKEKDKLKDFFAMGSIRAEKYKKIEKQIKELENE